MNSERPSELCVTPPIRATTIRSRASVGGTVCGLFAAVGYTAANICLRAVTGCDPIWVSTVKAFPTVALVGPWLLVHYARGEKVFPSRRVLVILVLTGLLAHLGGNVVFQWSLGVIGMALAVPLTLGTLILAGALLGRSLLGEPVTWRTLASIVILIVAIAMLSLGANEAHRSVVHEGPVIGPVGQAFQPDVEPADAGRENLTHRQPPGQSTQSLGFVAAGVSAALLAGLAYAVLGVVIRYGVTGRASLSVTLVTVASTGVLSLGGWSLWRMGWQGIWDTAPADLATMLVAGTCNAISFVALTRSLQLTSVVYANALNATQAAMAALAGIVFFQEAQSGELIVGLLLTIAGLVLMRQRR